MFTSDEHDKPRLAPASQDVWGGVLRAPHAAGQGLPEQPLPPHLQASVREGDPGGYTYCGYTSSETSLIGCTPTG